MQDHCNCLVPDSEGECQRCWLIWKHDGECQYPTHDSPCVMPGAITFPAIMAEEWTLLLGFTGGEIIEATEKLIKQIIKDACEAAQECTVDCDHTSYWCKIRKLGDI
jgi:hypothetical protein